MGFRGSSGITRHDQLVDLASDTILRDGGNFLADLVANRPAFGKPAAADRFFYATDEDKLYRDTGAAWQEIVQRQAATATDPSASLGRPAGAQTLTTGVEVTANTWVATFLVGMTITGASTERLRADRAGKYAFIFHVTYGASALGIRQTNLYKNGVQVLGASRSITGAAIGEDLAVIVFSEMAANDYVTGTMYQTTGGDLSGTPKLQAFFLGA